VKGAVAGEVKLAKRLSDSMQDREQNTFGQVLARARQKARLNLRHMAKLVIKEDGGPISFQYLNDLENDRRSAPSDHLLDELARVLQVSRNYLYYRARRIPADFPFEVEERQVDEAFQAMREKLESSPAT
jgi:transcriptional regulator with XRE-family HTH domain